MSINPRRTVLLICDVQDRFRAAIHGFDAMSSNIQKMIRAAQILDMRVLTTEQNPKALGPTIQELGVDKLPKHLNMGVYPKSKFSMMTPEVLRIMGGRWAASVGGAAGEVIGEEIERIIIVGIESHVCVTQTILDALPLSTHKPIVVADAVSSCNAAEVPIALQRLARAGAEVSSSESVLFQLMGDAAHPRFKEFSGLIKEYKDKTKESWDVLSLGPIPSAKM